MKDENNNTVVIDASYISGYLLPDERHSRIQEIFTQYRANTLHFTVPYLLPFEVVNSMRTAVIRKRINEIVVKELIRLFLSLDIEFLKTDFSKSFAIAVEYKLSIYDAAYIQLAHMYKLPLLTLDTHLATLAKV